jgi:hypothetical protein
LKTRATAIALSSWLAWTPAQAEQAQQSDAAAASEIRPTAESIHRLLDLTDAKATTGAISQQLDTYYTSFLNKLLEGNSVSAEQQQTIDRMRQQLTELVQQNFTWEVLEPSYMDIYAKSFSQSEIDSMIAFYGSPAGHAVILKLPLVMQNTMGAMTQRMQALIPKIQQMAKDTAAQIKASQEASPKPKTG